MSGLLRNTGEFRPVLRACSTVHHLAPGRPIQRHRAADRVQLSARALATGRHGRRDFQNGVGRCVDTAHRPATAAHRGGPGAYRARVPVNHRGHHPDCLKASMSAKRQPIEYKAASPEVRAVYDDIMATRKVDWINNFWKVLAHDPVTLRRIWSNIKEVMGPGTIDPLVKEMLYVAVSASNGCRYCIASHGAAARNKGMTESQYSELLAIVGLANETNRLVTALDVEVDERFL